MFPTASLQVGRPSSSPIHRIGCVALSFTAAAIILAGCTHSAHDGDGGPAVVAPVGSYVQEWRLPLNLGDTNDSIRGLYLREDVLFAYTQHNRVVGMNPATGRITFGADVTPGGIPLKPPIVMKDRYCFPDGSTIECYDKNGKLIDSVNAGRSIRSPGAAWGNTIYVGLDYPEGGRLAALDLTRKYNRARWEALTYHSGISAAPAVYQNVIYYGAEDGRVYAVGEDRSPVWPLEHSAFQTDGQVTADLRADDTGVYVASTDSKLYCLELGSGKIKWQYYASAPLTQAPVVTADSVYVIVPNGGRSPGGVVALDKKQGKYDREPRWVAAGAVRYLAEDERNVYLMTADNYIVAYDKTSGELKFKSQRNDLVAFAVNTKEKDSTIYGATRDGTVLAIKPVIKPGTVGPLVMAPTRQDLIVATSVEPAN